jgi:uncharacterized protein (DUF488 family)
VEAVFTVGYEERTIDEFVQRLQKYDIKVLVDVREIPASRKKGFSKTKLNEMLGSVGIKYLHVRELGSPRELRKKLYADKDYTYFFSEYKKHLNRNIDVLEHLYSEVISNESSCLMCMERLPSQCHRKVVAERIKEINGNGLQINHI